MLDKPSEYAMILKTSLVPNVRRVITGHNSLGKSVIVRDDVQPPKYWGEDRTNPIYDICRTENVPADIDSELVNGSFIDEIASRAEHVNPTGSVFRSFEFSPGTVTVRSNLFSF